MMTRLPPTPSCRLFFILAREARTGVIFRRGPSKRVQLIKWELEQDTFGLGQWFYGRIYEKRCDLSPDGTMLIYFAQKTNRRTLNDEKYTSAWTAISKVPYLSALTLWPNSGTTYGGGGLFETNDKVLLNGRIKPHPLHLPQKIQVVEELMALGNDLLHYRMERYGWKGNRKPHPKQNCHLVLDWAEKDGNDSFSLEQERFPSGVSSTKLEGVTWADWDYRGRLVYSKEGKLFAAEMENPESFHPKEIADFSLNKPEPKESPDWAKIW